MKMMIYFLKRTFLPSKTKCVHPGVIHNILHNWTGKKEL
jgi:hypothetical protein